jgi:hypothetical protein
MLAISFSILLLIHVSFSREDVIHLNDNDGLFLFSKTLQGKLNTFAVLKTTFLQSGRILTDQAGRSYCMSLKVTTLSFSESMLARNAAHPPK